MTNADFFAKAAATKDEPQSVLALLADANQPEHIMHLAQRFSHLWGDVMYRARLTLRAQEIALGMDGEEGRSFLNRLHATLRGGDQ